MNSPFLRTLGACACLLGAFSCGGNGSDPVAGGRIGGTGSVTSLTWGPITSVGSVTVSGNQYDVTHANITVDSRAGVNQSDLKKGMVVRVTGIATEQYGPTEVRQRIATAIVYTDTVQGFVERIAPDGLCLVVLGQNVFINTMTILDDSVPDGDLRNLDKGDLVKVSGFIRGNGMIVGTLVQRAVGPANYQVKGFVKNHNPSMNRFEIGHLTVDYAEAAMSQMPNSAGNSWDGLLVGVKGSAWTHTGLKPHRGTLTASTVELDGVSVDDTVIDDANVEGYVTQVAAQGDFFVEGVRVSFCPTPSLTGVWRATSASVCSSISKATCRTECSPPLTSHL